MAAESAINQAQVQQSKFEITFDKGKTASFAMEAKITIPCHCALSRFGVHPAVCGTF
jgi:hypothetical protein